jgi:hypothetical protein
MPIVILTGAEPDHHGCRDDRLLQHFGCARIVNNWDGRSELQDGDLAFTYRRHGVFPAGVLVLPVERAKVLVTEPCEGPVHG